MEPIAEQSGEQTGCVQDVTLPALACRPRWSLMLAKDSYPRIGVLPCMRQRFRKAVGTKWMHLLFQSCLMCAKEGNF